MKKISNMKRYLNKIVKDDLNNKMVFLSGPRQVGKTTLALQLLGKEQRRANEDHPAYLNWDFPENRKSIMEGILPAGEKLIIFDEIHKYTHWRNLIKGIYDKNKGRTKFLVTGSARLDYYRRGGDSLIGRYHFYRLHPLSLYEINPHPTDEHLKRLLAFGGFPEMYFQANKQLWKKWQRLRVSRIIKDDLLSLEQVREVSQIELLTTLLKERVGSLLSINSLREELSCSHEAVLRWIQILENIYYCFRISPYGTSKIKALKKDSKIYLWDWSELDDEAIKFENMVALNLLKYCHYHEDTSGDAMELRFIRDKEKREIDFVVLKNNKPLFAVECKKQHRNLSKNIAYYAKRTDIPVFYQIHIHPDKEQWNEHSETRCQIIPYILFCSKILKI